MWKEAVGGPYRNRIYGMGSFYTSSLSSPSVSGADTGTASNVADDEVREQVHLLNAELHRMQERDTQRERQFKEMEKKMEKKEKAMKRKIKRMSKEMKNEMMSIFKNMRAGPSVPRGSDDDDSGDSSSDATPDDDDSGDSSSDATPDDDAADFS